MSDDEREALDSLVAGPGWAHFTRYARKLYDEQLLDSITKIYDNPDNSNGMAEDKMKQLLAVRRAVMGLLEWPYKRVNELTHREQTGSRPRRR